MAINFPDTPTLNQSFTASGRTWTWNGYAWDSVGTVIEEGPVGPTGPQGPQGPQGIPGDIANLTATSPILFNPTTATISFAGVALDDITNVTAPSPTSGQALRWNGTAWVNADVIESYSLDSLTDVVISATPVAGDTIVYNGTNFVNQQAAEPLPAIMMMMGA